MGAISSSSETAELPWRKHSEYHWTIKVDTGTLDYWPTKHKWRWKDKNYQGASYQDVLTFILHRNIVPASKKKALEEAWSAFIPASGEFAIYVWHKPGVKPDPEKVQKGLYDAIAYYERHKKCPLY